MKFILKANLIEIGLFFVAAESRSALLLVFPMLLSANSVLIFKQQNELLLLQVEYEKINHEGD